MSKNLKARIFTSSILIFLLFCMLMSNFILCYFLIIIGLVSLLEFFKMNSIIFGNNKNKNFLINLLFSIYIFVFCSIFFIFSLELVSKVLIYIFLLTCVSSDIGGFIFGKIFKGKKLTRISPNKTISGSIGSFVFSALFLFFVIYYLTDNFNPLFLIIGLATSVGAQSGDLFFSFLKRKSFLKDTGSFLPGHGGILDRIDSMLIGIPLGLLTLMILS